MFFKKPDHSIDLNEFFKYHPKQPFNQVPFNASIAYFRKGEDKKGENINRQWLSYSQGHQKLFCSFCLAFSKENNRFTEGCGATKSDNPYERIKEHEQSLMHYQSAEGFMLWSKKLNVIDLLQNKRHENVKKRRLILERIIDTIKLIGKRGLSYRGAKNAEAAFTLKDQNLDHGNFLEIILLLAKYDPILQNHVEECFALSSKVHQVNSGPGRMGSLITFLSKTTVNYIVEEISKQIKLRIAQDVKNADIFSVQIDTTQDINVHDQLCVILRYVTDKANERMITMEKSKSSTGKSLADLISNILEKNGIDIKRCIGSSTDGAANMRGQYNGFTAWLTKISPEQNHVWCYAHILNLVMSDTSAICHDAVNLFGIMNSCATFVKESYMRMGIWEEKSKSKFINNIGETRWWSKDKCLTKVFGHFGNPETGIFVDLLGTLLEISTLDKFSADVRYKASTLLEKFQLLEVILTAHIFLQIFASTTPLSQYLQTKGLNLIAAFRMVKKTQETLTEHQRDFQKVLDNAKKFVHWANSKFYDKDMDLSINEDFVSKRVIKRKKMAGEKAEDEPVISSEDKYRINTYNVIYDCVSESMNSRFIKNENLFFDIGWLDPNNFGSISDMPERAFEYLAAKILHYMPDKEISKDIIQSELKDFASKWNTIKDLSTTDGSDGSDPGNEQEQNKDCKTSCKNCIACCFSVLLLYRLHTLAYPSLYIVFKYVLTLSCTQVRCETSFSKLKFILNRLRNCLTQEHLEAFLLMSIEKDILVGLDNDTIIDCLAQKSSSMRNLLT